MACCAARSKDAVRGEVLFRWVFHGGLRLGERGLGPLARLSPEARLWRDFLAMLRDSEEREVVCALDPEGVLRLRRVLSARLLPHSPALAGRVHRRLRTARPSPLADSAALALARLLERP